MAFSLLYAGLCRVLSLLRSARRAETDKDIEIMVLGTRCTSSNASFTHACGIDRRTGPSLPRSAVCSLDPGGGRS